MNPSLAKLRINPVRLAVGLVGSLAIFAGADMALAIERFDFAVVTPIAGDKTTGKVTNLQSGDLLVSGDAFRIEFRAHTSGALDVKVQSAQGEEIALTKGRRVEPGMRLSLPAAGEWYFLDDHTGVERLQISLSGDFGRESTEHRIRHVSQDFFTAGQAFADAQNDGSAPKFSGAPTATPGDPYDKTLVRTLDRAPKLISTYRSALEGAAKPGVSGTRGVTEARLYKQLSPGVVLIVTDGGLGTGSIIGEDGRIITNWHVVGDKESVGIVFKPPFGEEVKPSDVYTGLVEKVDPVLDLALVRVVDPPESLTVLELGEMRDVEVGADVHAIGHPTGEGWTYTKGFISQLRPNYQWPNALGFMHQASVIQTQTPISPGSSGSPLINESYKIIGINSFKKRGEALNFAVSVADVRGFLEAPGKPTVMRDAEPESCEPRRDNRDVDGDGRIDRVRLDTTCDGRIDLVIVDEDGDGESDYALADRDADGKPDVKMVSSEGDGRFDLWLFDSNGDGRYDTVGHDRDLDGNLDRYTRG